MKMPHISMIDPPCSLFLLAVFKRSTTEAGKPVSVKHNKSSTQGTRSIFGVIAGDAASTPCSSKEA
jgi:hypothetical protein